MIESRGNENFCIFVILVSVMNLREEINNLDLDKRCYSQDLF